VNKRSKPRRTFSLGPHHLSEDASGGAHEGVSVKVGCA
jgi:hypothetical protein